MTKESSVFALLTLVVIVGSVVLLAGVADHMRLDVIGVGSAIMVLGILGIAGYVGMLPDAEGHESGH